jgi:hypothetical protein
MTRDGSLRPLLLIDSTSDSLYHCWSGAAERTEKHVNDGRRKAVHAVAEKMKHEPRSKVRRLCPIFVVKDRARDAIFVTEPDMHTTTIIGK